METSLFILGILQVLCLLLYGWVGRVFISQPRWNHPAIFHNPVTRGVLVAGPLVAIVALVVCAFLFTNSPWLFLGLSVAGWVALSPRPNRGVM
jgi:hypothetical protein